MRRLLCVIALSAGCRHPAPARGHDDAGAHHHEDRAEPATAAPVLTLQVTVAGAPTTWTHEAFDRVPRLPGTNHAGEARDVWSLRALVTTLVGPDARVTRVTGDGNATISPEAWADATRTPILHTTRRGTLKFRWADAAGTWQEAEVRDVSALEIVR